MTTPRTGLSGTPAATSAGAAPFAVTAPPELVLAADRTGSTSVTVTNLTGRPVRARLVPKGQNGAQDAWLSVVGDAEVPIGVGGTITATVAVTIPADIPQGAHSLLLEVVAEDDTEAVTGQTVSFTVPAPVVVAKKTPWRLIGIIAAVVLLLGGGLTAFLLTRGGGAKPVAAPVSVAAPLVNGTPTEGQTLTTDNGIWTGEGVTFSYQWTSCAADGNQCTPLAGATKQSYPLTNAEVGKAVRIQVTAHNAGGQTGPMQSAPVGPIVAAVVEPAKVVVPPFVGLTLDAAKEQASQKGLTIRANVIGFLGDCTQRVLSQSPVDGTEVARGDIVTLGVTRLNPRCLQLFPQITERPRLDPQHP